MNRDEEEVTKKVVNAQRLALITGDFFPQVKEDMEYLELEEEVIRKISKDSLSKLIDDMIKVKAYEFLIDKSKKHSKVRSNIYEDLEGSPYFTDHRFTPNLVNTLFKMRTRMFDVRNNFRNMYASDAKCPLCQEGCDTQEHLLKCETLLEAYGKPVLVEYEDIFSKNTDALLKVTITLNELIEMRNVLLDPCNIVA